MLCFNIQELTVEHFYYINNIFNQIPSKSLTNINNLYEIYKYIDYLILKETYAYFKYCSDWSSFETSNENTQRNNRTRGSCPKTYSR